MVSEHKSGTLPFNTPETNGDEHWLARYQSAHSWTKVGNSLGRASPLAEQHAAEKVAADAVKADFLQTQSVQTKQAEPA